MVRSGLAVLATGELGVHKYNFQDTARELGGHTVQRDARNNLEQGWTDRYAAKATLSLVFSSSFRLSGTAVSASVGSSTGTSGKATRSLSDATGTFGF